MLLHPRMREDNVVVITGASAGVGRATVRELARDRCRIALLARGEDGLKGAAEEVHAAGARALPLLVDVADPQQVEAAAQEVERVLGPIDVWINDAMTTVFAPSWELSPEELRRVTEVTYLGAVYGTLAALRRMVPRNRGCIVQVGSALSYRSIPLQSAYCGAKHALRGFTDAVRTELLHEGSEVRITMVQLPGLNTPQFDWCESKMPRKPQPVAPIYQPEVAARAVYSAAHGSKREIFVGRSTAMAIWGQRLNPWLMDRLMARKAWKGQLSDRPAEAERKSNLWKPVPGDHGAHGSFDDQATPRALLGPAGHQGMGLTGVRLGVATAVLLGVLVLVALAL